MIPDWLTCSDEVTQALRDNRPVVALESTLISHGLPWPTNFETATNSEAVVREAGAVPATIAVLNGRPTVGLCRADLEFLAKSEGVAKASRRDLAAVVAQKKTGATTVSATMALAHAAGVTVMATGGIGGAHPRHDGLNPFDISADLTELSRTAVLVVCAGAKSILDLPQTLELLETFGVPVLGYRTHAFPAFYVRASSGTVSTRVETAQEAAAIFQAHVQMGGRGTLLAQPLDEDVAIAPDLFEAAMKQAETEALLRNISGAKLTPFLLSRLADLTIGKTLAANQTLILANARLAAEVASHMH